MTERTYIQTIVKYSERAFCNIVVMVLGSSRPTEVEYGAFSAKEILVLWSKIVSLTGLSAGGPMPLMEIAPPPRNL